MRRLRSWLSLKTLVHVCIVRPLIKILFGINVYGKQNLEGLWNYIMIANHNSHLDIFLLFCLVPINQIGRTHPVAAEEYFSKSKLVYHLVNFLFSPIWVPRGGAGKHADPLQGIRDMLNKGHNVIIFPEGTRGLPGIVKHFQSGIGRIAEQYRHTPIVPVFLSGPERSFPKRTFFPLPIWNNVLIGPPQIYGGTRTDIIHNLEKRIHELSESETALRHRKIPRRKKPAVSVAILGIDGSGKSTISKGIALLLSERASVAMVSDKLEFFENAEPREIQPLVTEELRGIVGGYAKRAGSLKAYKIPKLAELLLRNNLLAEIRRWYNPDFIILDGSPLLNLMAWAILYKEEYFNEEICLKAIKILTAEDHSIPRSDPIYRSFPELTALKRLKLNHLEPPDFAFYLDVDPRLALERISSRGQELQAHETTERLGKLSEAYKTVCGVVEKSALARTCVVEGDDTIENIQQKIINILNPGSEKE